MKSKTVAALAVFAALLITAVAGVALTPATAAAVPGVTTLAGSPGTVGTVNATGTAARFLYPRGVTVDGSGNVYVADTNASVIRKITAAGVVTTFAGTANSLGSADGTGAAARFNYPEGITRDAAGNIYVADTQNNMIRKITPAGAVTTVAGQLGVGGFGGWVDGSTAVAMFTHPRGIVLDAAGNIYVGDSGNDAVRKITPAGVVSTMAGGVGVFNNPRGLAVDANGIIYVADFNNHRIARVTPAGVVTTFAGSTTGVSGSADGSGTAALFSNPDGVVRDGSGNIYVADSGNNTIRRMASGGAVVTTYAGAAGIAGSADGTLAAARFNDPRGLGVDTAGNVYIADRGNSTIRKTVTTVITITATADVGGTITPAGAIGVSSGTNSTTFTITPNANYARATVLVGGVNNTAAVTSGTYTFTNITTNQTIRATFVFVGFQITSSAGANGTISPLGATNVPTAGSQAYTITPNTGYHIADVLVDGLSVGAVASYTFTNVTAVHTIAASFAINTYTITTTAGANGTITPANPAVNYGANQTFAIAGNTGYHVLDVLVDGVSHQGSITSYTFTNVTATHTISATFETDPTITVIAPSGLVTWPAGSTQTVSWTSSPAVSVGEFRVWLVDQNNPLLWYLSQPVAAVGGQTLYSTSFSVASVPSGSYYVVVAYRPDITLWSWPTQASSAGTITILAPTITVTAPSGLLTWPAASTQTVSWTSSAAVSVGEFRVWLVDQNNPLLWYLSQPVAAVGGRTLYSTSISTAGVPSGSYYVVVAYRPDVNVWSWPAQANSSGTVTLTGGPPVITVTAPSGLVTWSAGSAHTVSWTSSPAASVGEFRVWLVDQNNPLLWYLSQPVAAVGGQTLYSTSISTAGVPSGSYYVVVAYRPDVNVWSWPAQANSSGTVTVL